MGVTVADIISAYGANYVDEGQNLSRLLTAMKQKSVTAGHAQSRVIKDTVYRLGNAQMTRIVQPFQKDFTPVGDLIATAKPIPLYQMKGDLSIFPDDIVATWLGFLEGINENDRSKWPLIRYIMEVHYAGQIKEDLELNEYFKGVYTAPTSGTPGAAGTGMNGIKKLVDDGIASGDMNQILLSDTPSRSNMFDIVEEFVDGVHEVVRSQPIKMYMSEQNKVNYFRDKRDTHGGDSNYDDSKAMSVDGYSNIKIVGLPSMAGSNYIFATPESNFFHIRRTTGMKKPDVQKEDRQVKVLGDWWEGLGFGIDALVFAYNGQNTP